MKTFADRLREEIEYKGLTRKELCYRANIKIRALDMYLGTQGSMPPADVAVRIAKALGVTVEYLVDGDEDSSQTTLTESAEQKNKRAIKKLDMLPIPVQESIRDMIDKISEFSAKSQGSLVAR